MLRQFIARFRNVAVSVAATMLVIVTLTACGVKGPLKLPPPTPPAAGAGATAPEAPPPVTTEPPAASAPKAETKP